MTDNPKTSSFYNIKLLHVYIVMFYTFGNMSFLDPARNSTLIQNSQDIFILVSDQKIHHRYYGVAIISNNRFYISFYQSIKRKSHMLIIW